MEGESTDGNVQLTVDAWQLLSVCNYKVNVIQRSAFACSVGNLDWCLGQVDPDHLVTLGRQSRCNITWPGGDPYCTLTLMRRNGLDQTR